MFSDGCSLTWGKLSSSVQSILYGTGHAGSYSGHRFCMEAATTTAVREFQITLTPPWLVLSPGEKGGGLGVKLATSPRKTFACYRNTYKNESSYLSSWERRTSTKKIDDALQ